MSNNRICWRWVDTARREEPIQQRSKIVSDGTREAYGLERAVEEARSNGRNVPPFPFEFVGWKSSRVTSQTKTLESERALVNP